MKGLLKGLRYISQIFENEKDQEIQIGHPTDVKHVAHIGWDGPSSANSAPSWMNEFKSVAGFSSAPLGVPGDKKEDGSVKWSSEDLTRRGGSVQSCGRCPARDLPDVPKSSRWHSSSNTDAATSSVESPTNLKSEKARQSRRSSKGSQSPAREWSDGTRASHQTADPDLGSSSPVRLDIPKKTRRKKSKESSGGGSTRSSTRSKDQATSLVYESPYSDPGPGSGSGPLSMPKSRDQFGQSSKLEGYDNRDEKAISRIL
ncbi:hypothetical protein CDL15_Pgr018933 [Punica granatum]|nr:hypothetical protein CDL15_Pgr018933 [Punica granatum]PKI66762.1 hypothetical protein CRG98_012768 [Punica granatum]